MDCCDCTFNTLETRVLNLARESQRRKVMRLLSSCDLRPDDVDVYIGVFDGEDNLLGGAGLKENIVKCVAVDANTRDMALTNKLIGGIMAEAHRRGISQLFLFTKPENEEVFRSLAFFTVGRASKSVMMETDPRGIGAYVDSLRKLRKQGRNGAIVMNCNPMTLGHLYLIKEASRRVDNLYIIPVREERGHFSYAERRDMIKHAVANLDNVIVCEGSPYAVSAATFPSYFLKRVEDATDTSISLDLDIFTRHIAPALGVTVRFAGNEPTDMLTRRYNDLMRVTLPTAGVEFCEIERLSIEGNPVSATKVRGFLKAGNVSAATTLVPPTSRPAILADMATQALLEELHCTPKPGLVDEADNGSHSDMDLPLMERSIAALRPLFVKAAQCVYKGADSHALRRIGIEAEKDMLIATGGVNTHRGAIFALMLALAAYCRLTFNGNKTKISPYELSAEIARLTAEIKPETLRPEVNSNGEAVRRQFGIPGAVDNARSGYHALVNSWLPFYRSLSDDDPLRLHRTLLKIMSELDDTNIWHRGGQAGMQYVSEVLDFDLQKLTTERLNELNEGFKARNLSPGGSADMLALTLLFDRLCD